MKRLSLTLSKPNSLLPVKNGISLAFPPRNHSVVRNFVLISEKPRETEIQSAIDEISTIIELKDNSSAYIPTRPFLNVCNSVLQVLEKIGPTMSVLRHDISQNIQKLDILYESDTSRYSNLIDVLEKEAGEGTGRKGESCSKAILWLTRCLDFTVALLERMVENDEEHNMEEVVEESYVITLKPWHGWISFAAFRVAIRLVPDKKTFISILMSNYEDYSKLQADMESFVSLLAPILQDCHSILRQYNMDGLKST
ncbi:glycolipid transfer protein 3-like [Rutidosis leptorrhynchoides]|uniref:glycolipid transfer protein 3-like n=1 Tax=Rutidosis leptorrhynchoides TaxID=125765 RepID=UPI003A9A409E